MFLNYKILSFIFLIIFSKNVFSNEIQNNYFFKSLLELNKEKNIEILLSSEDIKKYKNIFSLQKEGNWKESKIIIESLDNKILMGHVKYQKLMHPTKYRSPYSELKDWLDHYSDHPMADRIWKLAKLRQPGGVKPPRSPQNIVRISGYGLDRNTNIALKRFKISKKYYKYYSQIRNLVKRGRPTSALKQLNIYENLPENIYDDLRGIISAGYYAVGKDKVSLKLAISSASRSGLNNPTLYWRAALAAYRLDKKDIALNNFILLTKIKEKHWLKSAAAYWVAKIYKEMNNEIENTKFLKIAVEQLDTFYGQLALESLKIHQEFDWSMKNPGKIFTLDIFNNAYLKRAIALSAVERYGEADQEIRMLYGFLSESNLEELVEITEYLNLPAVQMRLGDKLSQNGKNNYMALYPSPNWITKENLKIDGAFLWALVRKESSFYLKAKSNRGARGLMQLMPSTARMVSKDRSLRGANRWKLFDLHRNTTIGQELILRLLKLENISNSLIPLLIAWNAGPNRLDQWNKKINKYKDPLLYIESIPSYETRWFVKKVLKNLWIYRDKYEQIKYSRKALSLNDWPKYINLNYTE